MGVPRHLQVPLSIDTSISYSLDKSIFPGLDDPRYKYEPVLLIAPNIQGLRHAPKTKEISEYQVNQKVKKGTFPDQSSSGYDNELLGDLLEIIDISAKDLILGLRNTDDYLSLVEDVIQGLPHSDELRYLDGPPGPTNTTPQSHFNHSDRQSVNTCASKYSSFSHKCHAFHRDQTKIKYSDLGNRECQMECRLKGSHSVNSCVSTNYCVGKGHPVPNGVHHQSLQSLCVNNTMSSKRKRGADSFSGDFNKRLCYGNEQMGEIIPHQNSWRRYGNGFNGISHCNPVRVF